MSTIGDVLSGQARWVVLEADCAEVLPMLPPRSVDHVIQDPPFSKHVHSLQRRQGGIGRAWGRGEGAQVVAASLGFEHLSEELRRVVAVQAARVARRWVLTKTDEESRHLWQAELERAGARHVRCGVWRKVNGQPQLSGDRPAVGHESFEIAHARGQRLRWNGGGHPAWWDVPCLWEVPIATDRHGTGDRVHTTQTPIPLWLAIVERFTDPGDLVLDPFCGSGSLGIACVRLGRRYIGMDNGMDATGKPWAQWAREGIEAESRGLSRSAARAGQMGLFA